MTMKALYAAFGKEENGMCLRNLFCGNVNCTWLLFIIAIILILDNCGGCGDNGDCGDCGYTATPCGRGC